MLILTLHTLVIAGFLAVWLLVVYVATRELARQRKTASLDAHRFDATHAPVLPSPRSQASHADRRSTATVSQR